MERGAPFLLNNVLYSTIVQLNRHAGYTVAILQYHTYLMTLNLKSLKSQWQTCLYTSKSLHTHIYKHQGIYFVLSKKLQTNNSDEYVNNL